eukprot:scaffold225_cov388-Prasinococcus_capsulatus_cf.AAC.6
MSSKAKLGHYRAYNNRHDPSRFVLTVPTASGKWMNPITKHELDILPFGPGWRRFLAIERPIIYAFKNATKSRSSNPTSGWKMTFPFMDTNLCTRVDFYGFSSGGGKYFARGETVRYSHRPEIEHYSRRLLSAAHIGPIPRCIYGS